LHRKILLTVLDSN